MQGPFPIGLQLAGDEPVLRLDELVAAAGPVDGDLSAFQPQFPELLQSCAFGVDLLRGVEADLDRPPGSGPAGLSA